MRRSTLNVGGPIPRVRVPDAAIKLVNHQHPSVVVSRLWTQGHQSPYLPAAFACPPGWTVPSKSEPESTLTSSGWLVCVFVTATGHQSDLRETPSRYTLPLYPPTLWLSQASVFIHFLFHPTPLLKTTPPLTSLMLTNERRPSTSEGPCRAPQSTVISSLCEVGSMNSL